MTIFFVYDVKLRGNRFKSFRVGSHWVKRYLYQCKVKKYSFSKLPSDVKAQVDPTKAKQEFDAKIKARISLCDKAIALLSK